MYITSFQAKTFRNIRELALTFDDGVQLFIGDNAQGKTNAIEGMYIFARGKSFRSVPERELAMFAEDGFSLALGYHDRLGEHTMTYTYYKGQRKRTVDGHEVRAASEMLGHLRAVLFTPDHLRLVKDSPEERRSFLNIALSQCYPMYVKLYADFKRAQDERNCLLKQAQKGLYYDMPQIEAWSNSMAEYAARIYALRRDYIKKLKSYAEPILARMTKGEETLTVGYKCDIPEGEMDTARVADIYRTVFTQSIAREIAAGCTLFGPARDDIELCINGQSVRHFASQGQQRSVVLALKLSEGEVCREVCGEYPVYILDDVLSELDTRRRAFLFHDIQHKQLMLTGCEHLTDIPSDIHTITVEKGQYVSSRR